MQVKTSHPSKTEAIVTIVADANDLKSLKEQVVASFQNSIKIPGFREGKVPTAVLEKNIPEEQLQSEFLEKAIEQLFVHAIKTQKLRPVDRPQVSIKKFVPYTTLEFDATLPVISEIKLADYKKIKVPRTTVKITAKDIEDVIKSLQARMNDKKDVDRPAKNGDQVWIDFKGVDAKGKPVNGAEGKDYPLTIGSKAFIPGFEENMIGMKAGDEKSFTLTFPSDYGVKVLANKKVTFTVNITKVQEIVSIPVDDAFAAKAGPFKTLAELKADIKKQVTIEKQREADRAFENELILAISNKSTLEIPEVLINDQIDKIEQEERQNITYRGQTWQEHLDEEGVTEEEHRVQKRPQAVERLKASIVMAEIADAEKLEVTEDELDVRMQLLKGQYQDPQMQAELAKPEARRDIAGRLLTEKTLEKVVEYASK